MKTPKEKAKELIDKFTLLTTGGYDLAKESSLICVDELIQLRKGYFDCTNPMNDEKYWQEVKSEIEKL